MAQAASWSPERTLGPSVTEAPADSSGSTAPPAVIWAERVSKRFELDWPWRAQQKERAAVQV